MRAAQVVRALVICGLLAGCQTRGPVVPKIVRVTVEKIVPVPEALTEPCDEVPTREQTLGEAVRVANARLASLKACNGKLAEIRGLGK
jgi:hypothetical protein